MQIGYIYNNSLGYQFHRKLLDLTLFNDIISLEMHKMK